MSNSLWHVCTSVWSTPTIQNANSGVTCSGRFWWCLKNASDTPIRILECGVALVIHDLLDLLFHLVLSTPMTLNGIFGSGLFQIQVIHPNSSTPPTLRVKPKMKKLHRSGSCWLFFFWCPRSPYIIVMKSPHFFGFHIEKNAASWRKKRSPLFYVRPPFSKATAKL